MSEFIYCGQCGKTNPISNKFCSNCGSQFATDNYTGTPYPKVASTASEIDCPHYHRNDAVSKVSGIVSGQTIRERGAIYGEKQTAYISSNTSSTLAQLLRPPSQPLNVEKGADVLSQIGCGFFALVALLVGLIDYIGKSSLSIELDPFGIVLIGIGGVGIYYAFKGFSSEKDKNEASQKYTAKVQIWQRAASRWQQSYYCNRCDLVFVKGEKETVQPTNFDTLLYK